MAGKNEIGLKAHRFSNWQKIWAKNILQSR